MEELLRKALQFIDDAFEDDPIGEREHFDGIALAIVGDNGKLSESMLEAGQAYLNLSISWSHGNWTTDQVDRTKSKILAALEQSCENV